jgi:hypothetical protein
MTKTISLLFIIFTSCLLFIACQKEIYYEDIKPPHYDSLTLVRSVVTRNYDKSDQLLWKSDEHYTYDESGNKTFVSFKDSSENGTNSYTETFNYDNNKRLSSFETTNRLGYFSQVDFLYAPNGNLDKVVFHLLNGQILENTFLHSSVNNNHVITMFDTSKLGGRHTYYRPQIVKFTFNASNLLIRQVESETGPNKSPANWFRDTFDYKFNYTPEQDMKNMTVNYTFVSNSMNTPYTRDSVEFYRTSSDNALFNTYQYLYKNLYWFSFSEYVNNSFANSMVHNSFYPNYVYYYKQPLEKITYYSAVSSPFYSTNFTGNFQNSFNNQQQLMRSVYPKQFANQQGGIQEIEYEYLRKRK